MSKPKCFTVFAAATALAVSGFLLSGAVMAQQIDQRFVAHGTDLAGRSTCIGCHKGIAHKLPIVLRDD